MTLAEKAKAAALGYVDSINEKDLPRLMALFAENGVLNHPFGLFEGKPKLEEFYGGLVMKADTHMTVKRVVTEGALCSVELEARSPQAPDKAQYAIDLFQVDEQGLITEVAIYYRNFDLR